MKNIKTNINPRQLIKGIAKCVSGIVLASFVPAGLATSIYYTVESKNNYNAMMNEIKTSTEFQEFRDSELKKNDERYKNGEIGISTFNTEYDYLTSNNLVKDYAKQNSPITYREIIKSDDHFDICLSVALATGFGLLAEVGLMWALSSIDDKEGLNYPFASGVDDIKEAFEIDKKGYNKKLSGEPENIPEVNLE